MLVDTITLAAMGGAVLALIQWLSIVLLNDSHSLAVCNDDGRGGESD